ncbi:hypothetical protein ccbrp13_42280 [Ktedonobacteria bacterium brp13]|nr:hypothetical protein ccbrp13_42280 [Ktedonobacteria bacterium brp13]
MSNQLEGLQSNEQQQQSRTFNPNEHLIQLKSREGLKDYLPVQWRLVWFREQCPEGTIDTEEVLVDLDREVEEESFAWNAEKRRSERVMKRAHGYARFRATVTDGKGGCATGTKSENAASFPDYIEKAETGAIGRALAALGYGTQFAPEMDEAHRIVDAPVEPRAPSGSPNGNGNSYSNGNGNGNGYSSNRETNGSLSAVRPQQNGNGHGQPASNGNGSNGNRPAPESDAAASITEQQISSIRKLSEHLNKALPENLPTLSNLEARKVIQQLSAEYKESKQQSKAS